VIRDFDLAREEERKQKRLVREFVPEQNQNMSKEIRDFDSAER
jgi:hypothetical protein